MSEKQKKRALITIFIVILFDITGLGMIIPLTPILAREFGEGGLKIGLLISSYSVVQFLFAPFWGRLSDVFGRKSIILMGLFGSVLAHTLFAFSDTFGDIFLSRILAGFFGANIAVATAYIADVTSLEKRSKNMGLIGMAFGLGFTIGPIFGFLFILLGEKVGDIPPYGANFAAMGAAVFCFINFLMSFLFLKESLFTDKKPAKKSVKIPSPLFYVSQLFKKSSLFARPSLYVIWESLRTAKLGVVLIMSFILWFSLAQIEPVLILLVQDDFGWGKTTAYSSFIYIGFLMVLSQGYLVRKWIPKWGESFINQKGLLTMSIGLISIGFSAFFIIPSSDFFSLAFFVLFFGVTLFSIGYSLSHTSLNGALSLLTSEKKQGSIFGINQSLSALARITGPAMGGWFYQYFSHESPFFIAGFLALGALALAFFSRKNFPNTGRTK